MCYKRFLYCIISNHFFSKLFDLNCIITAKKKHRVVWVILVIELIFEVLIRPSDYGRLVQSDKAYTPSTARFISQMYIIGEAVALATFIPEIGCLQDTYNVCSNRSLFGPLNQVRATVLAVLGPSSFKSLYGRFFMGLMALRFFGVVRHWKQMLINQTFHPTKREGLEKWVIPYDPKRWGNKKLDVSVLLLVPVHFDMVL